MLNMGYLIINSVSAPRSPDNEAKDMYPSFS